MTERVGISHPLLLWKREIPYPVDCNGRNDERVVQKAQRSISKAYEKYNGNQLSGAKKTKDAEVWKIIHKPQKRC